MVILCVFVWAVQNAHDKFGHLGWSVTWRKYDVQNMPWSCYVCFFLMILINRFEFLIKTWMGFVFVMKFYEQLLLSSVKLIVKCLKGEENLFPILSFDCQRCKGGVC